jgi:hypothetical protein
LKIQKNPKIDFPYYTVVCLGGNYPLPPFRINKKGAALIKYEGTKSVFNRRRSQKAVYHKEMSKWPGIVQ